VPYNAATTILGLLDVAVSKLEDLAGRKHSQLCVHKGDVSCTDGTVTMSSEPCAFRATLPGAGLLPGDTAVIMDRKMSAAGACGRPQRPVSAMPPVCRSHEARLAGGKLPHMIPWMQALQSQ